MDSSDAGQDQEWAVENLAMNYGWHKMGGGGTYGVAGEL
jgi:hypothetical protein